MLTDDEIRKAIRKGNLVQYSPLLKPQGTKRAFLMSKSLSELISAKRQSNSTEQIHRWAALEADILFFVEGKRIDSNQLKQLKPAKFEHWCLRSKRPRPSLRMFGRFAQPDVFIGTHIVERKALGGFSDINWEIEKLVCEKDIWMNECGLPNRPFSGAKYTDYITQNASENVRIAK